MDLNLLTEKFQEALRAAQPDAVRRNHQQLEVEHLLASLLEQEGGLATSILKKAQIQPAPIVRRIEQELDKLPQVKGASGGPDQIYLAGRLQKLFARAEDEAKRLKDEYISVEHVLLAALEDSGPPGKSLKRFGRTGYRLMTALQDVRGSQR